MMLVPYELLAGWWTKRLAFGTIIYEPDGRYQFCERDGVTQKQGANFGSALVVFPTFHIAESPRSRAASVRPHEKAGHQARPGIKPGLCPSTSPVPALPLAAHRVFRGQCGRIPRPR
jgi:hypothetical protein